MAANCHHIPLSGDDRRANEARARKLWRPAKAGVFLLVEVLGPIVIQDRIAARIAQDGCHVVGIEPECEHFPLCPRARTFTMAVGKSLMGQEQTHAPRQIPPYRSARRCGRARSIRATPLSEGPQSAASRLIARPGRPTRIL
jgi:hypothetical protein